MTARRASGPLARARRALSPRPALAAVLLGAAIAGCAVAALAAPRSYGATYIVVDPQTLDSDARGPRRESITIIAGGEVLDAQPAGGEPVCVRLCDGYFFPLPVAAGDGDSAAAACGGLCPDAATEVFYRNGSDRIEDAISARGQPYSALPASLRYRAGADKTCACRRGVAAYAPLSDATLRPGDVVMTPAGFAVFRGREGGAATADDFVALGQSGLPPAERIALQTLERASVSAGHPTLKTWLAAEVAAGAQATAVNGDSIRLVVWRGGGD